MTKIKLCGLKRPCDIEAANELKPDYIGFVMVPGRKRTISIETAAELKQLLDPAIKAVGVFINEEPSLVAELLNMGIIDIAQLHGSEDETYIKSLRALTDKPLIRAIVINGEEDLERARTCSADYLLLDSGTGGGQLLDRELLKDFDRPYFLAGGLSPENVGEAIRSVHPFAVDVSSGIEENGLKVRDKMAAFVAAVRKEDES